MERPAEASRILEAAGYDFSWEGTSGSPTALILRNHVWLELYGPYLPTRGTALDDITSPTPQMTRESIWISIDPTITQRAAPTPVRIEQRLGLDSAGFWQSIIGSVTEIEAGEAVGDLPADRIRTGARRAAEALIQHLRVAGVGLETWLNAPGEPSLGVRGILPGNLPYEVVGRVQTVDPAAQDELVELLRSWRGIVRMRLGNQTDGALTDWIQLGLPRLAQGTLAIHFTPATETDETNLAPYLANNEQVVRGLANLRLHVDYETQDLLKGDMITLPLGHSLWVELRPGEGETQRIPLLAGGFYVVTPPSRRE